MIYLRIALFVVGGVLLLMAGAFYWLYRFFENEKKNKDKIKKVAIMIGAEGGFSESEIEKALSVGGKIISLGKRILRTETAAITATAMCMLYCELEESL